MRQILVHLPSKLVFVLALLGALGVFAYETLRRRKDPKRGLTSNPVFLLVGAFFVMWKFGGAGVPSAEMLAKPWAPIPIFAYGVMLGTALIVGWFLAMRLAKNDGIRQDDAAQIYMYTAVWSIVGARVLYVLANLGEFADNPFGVVFVWKGGLVAYGGMIGGFLASWYQCRKRCIKLLQWADAAAPSVVLGTGITRFGCLLYGCDYGRVAHDLPWAITFPQNSAAWDDHIRNLGLAHEAARSFPVHPTQLYEAAVGFALFGLLMLLRRVRRFSGQVFLGWVIGYGVLRPIIEIYRDDKQRGNVGPLSTSQFIGVVATLLGLALLVVLWRRHRREPGSLRYWEAPAGGAAKAAS